MKKYLTLAIAFILLTGNLAFAESDTNTDGEKGNTVEIKTEQLTRMGLTEEQITAFRALTTQEERVAYLKEIKANMAKNGENGNIGKKDISDKKLSEMGLTAEQITAFKALTTQEEQIAYLKNLRIGIMEANGDGEKESFGEKKLKEMGLTAEQIIAFKALTTQDDKIAYLQEIGIKILKTDNGNEEEKEVEGRKLKLEKLGLTEDQITEFKALKTVDEKKAYLEDLGIEIPNNQNNKTKRFSDEGEIKNLKAVNFLQEKGIINGSDDGNFNPDDSVNRAEAMKMILEAIGESADNTTNNIFKDIESSAWYAGYVKRAKLLGFVNGYSDGSFKPAQAVNRVELLKMLLRAFKVNLSSITASDLYSDTPTTAWYAKYLQYAKDNSLISAESDGLFHPEKGMTRDEFSAVIYKLMAKLGLAE